MPSRRRRRRRGPGPSTMAPAVPAMVDDLLEEIFIRFPPDDPNRLLRAALVCRSWCRVLSGPGFHRRFRERHRAPPLLGFFRHGEPLVRFVPTIFSRPPRLRLASRLSDDDRRIWRAIDARHGRILLHRGSPDTEEELAVSSSITGNLRRLIPMPPRAYRTTTWNAAVRCATAGCDHHDCCHGPFLVAFMATDGHKFFYACVYSDEAGAWSEHTETSIQRISIHDWNCLNCIHSRPSVLVGNAFYYRFSTTAQRNGILKHDLGTREISLFYLPRLCYWDSIVLTVTEDGGLGLATMTDQSTLILWTREADPDSGLGWVQSRVIDLRALHLIDDARFAQVVGFADGAGLILVQVFCNAIFTVDIKSGCVKKIVNACIEQLDYVIPYVSFYTPVLRKASSGAEPRVSASTASQIEGAHVKASGSRGN